MAELYHYGTKRHSGRYPWGSGEDPYQHQSDFLSSYKDLKSQGLSETEIAEFFGISTTDLRKKFTYETASKKASDRANAIKMYNEGYSKTYIGEKLGISEGTVRNYLKQTEETNAKTALNIADQLKRNVDQFTYIDVGKGTNAYLGVSEEKMKAAVQLLKDQGYELQTIYIPQVTNPDQYTTFQILCPPGTTQKDVLQNQEKITFVGDTYSNDGGKTFLGIKKPENLDSSRLAIRYKEDGGEKMDGVIELRPGVDDISLGNASYAQVRIAVDGTHYLKGMAIYSDDLPPGVDVRFNTNKSKSVPALGDKSGSVLKLLKRKENGEIDEDNPFGTTLRMVDGKIVGQRTYTGKDGKEHLSVINIVRQEGDWDEWSRTLATQFLSKQPIKLIQQQLKKTLGDKKDEYEDILKITQPEVKKQLLNDFAESCESDASELKVAALPRQASKVILPLTKLSENEVYAPSFNNGEMVALVRYPHAGTFEIPILKVNNRNAQGKSILGQALDAIGINPKVAGQLSGADFDGDTVVVIPTKNQQITASKPLKALAEFNPKESYPEVPGMKYMKDTQMEMGKISNLITDMQIKGAKEPEVIRAVRHSMVVIDAEKHKLNYKQSEIDNGISELKKIYQGSPTGGASTLFSLANREKDVNVRRKSIDPKTGELQYEYEKISNKTKDVPIKDKKTNEIIGWKTIPRTIKSTEMREKKDARELSSGSPKENIYADYANSLKALANNARKESLTIAPTKKNSNAAKVYEKEVQSLDSKLNLVLQNKPRERKAQIMANATVRAKINSNPDMTYEQKKELRKKYSTQAIAAERSNAKTLEKAKKSFSLTSREWEAINAGAVSSNKASKIISSMDKKALREYAIPRSPSTVSASKQARIKALSANGYTIAEIADSVGLSTSTVSEYIK